MSSLFMRDGKHDSIGTRAAGDSSKPEEPACSDSSPLPYKLGDKTVGIGNHWYFMEGAWAVTWTLDG